MNGVLHSIQSNVFQPDVGEIRPGDGLGANQLNEAVLNAALREIWERSSGSVDTIVVNGAQNAGSTVSPVRPARMRPRTSASAIW